MVLVTVIWWRRTSWMVVMVWVQLWRRGNIWARNQYFIAPRLAGSIRCSEKYMSTSNRLTQINYGLRLGHIQNCRATVYIYIYIYIYCISIYQDTLVARELPLPAPYWPVSVLSNPYLLLNSLSAALFSKALAQSACNLDHCWRCL